MNWSEYLWGIGLNNQGVHSNFETEFQDFSRNSRTKWKKIPVQKRQNPRTFQGIPGQDDKIPGRIKKPKNLKIYNDSEKNLRNFFKKITAFSKFRNSSTFQGKHLKMVNSSTKFQGRHNSRAFPGFQGFQGRVDTLSVLLHLYSY